MTKQAWLLLLRPPHSRCAPGFKRAWPLCPDKAQAPSFHTSVKWKHAVLHHSCFGQTKVPILILIFEIQPASSLCHPLLSIISSFVLVQLSKAPPFQVSLCASRESSRPRSLNIHLLSPICQQVSSKRGHQRPFKSVTACSSPQICDEKKVKKKKDW